MVPLPQAVAANDSFVKSHPLVAVFVGGTSGIGQYSINELCRAHASTGAGLRIYIVGRNDLAAQRIAEENRARTSNVDVKFVTAIDSSLLEDVDLTCEEIMKREREHGNEGRIDLLVFTQGVLTFEGRKETAEGLDFIMSLHYYSRIRFTTNLLPLLRNSTLPTGSRVVSVFAAGLESMGTLYPSDLSLREPKHYSFANKRKTVVHMTTMSFEHLARENAGKVAFVHVFPGLVVTPAFDGKQLPWWLRATWQVARPVLQRTAAVTPERIGQTIVFLLCGNRFPALGKGGEEMVGGTDGAAGSGAYAVGYDAESCGVEKHYVELRKQGFEKRVWEHTMEALEAAGKGKVFKN